MGSRKEGSNPRALGLAPRQMGTNPRAVAEKNGDRVPRGSREQAMSEIRRKLVDG